VAFEIEAIRVIQETAALYDAVSHALSDIFYEEVVAWHHSIRYCTSLPKQRSGPPMSKRASHDDVVHSETPYEMRKPASKYRVVFSMPQVAASRRSSKRF
jgi:hypothetical protein